MIRTLHVPALVAAAGLAGLWLALTGDGWRDHVAAAALGLPLSLALRAFVRRT